MIENTGGLAFITNLRISNKIAAGFGLILLILTVSSVMATLSFNRVTSAIENYSELVARSATFRDIDLAVTRLRGRVRRTTSPMTRLPRTWRPNTLLHYVN